MGFSNGSGLARSGVAALAFTVMLAGGATPVIAQATEVHAALIQEGTCESPGTAAFALTEMEAEAVVAGTPVPVPERVGSESAVPLQVSDTTLEATLADLVDGEFAIVVYDGDETMIACGAIGGPLTMQMAGMVMPGDELAVGLAEIDDSGFSGVALIRAEGKTATVRIFLAG